VAGDQGASAPPIGFDRLPGELRRLLDDAATVLASAASVFYKAIDERRPVALDELEGLGRDGDRIVEDIGRQLRGGRVSSRDRARLLGLSKSLDASLDALVDVAHAATGCDCGPPGRALAAVVRDATRGASQALRRVAAHSMEPTASGMADLEREGRRIQRQALAEVTLEGEDPLAAIRRKTCLEQLGRALELVLDAADAAERTRAALT
jgi:uncharacterized protein Yka (UPF0111/DUF47 family)